MLCSVCDLGWRGGNRILVIGTDRFGASVWMTTGGDGCWGGIPSYPGMPNGVHDGGG